MKPMKRLKLNSPDELATSFQDRYFSVTCLTLNPDIMRIRVEVQEFTGGESCPNAAGVVARPLRFFFNPSPKQKRPRWIWNR
jgi:hypothetical protein